MGKSGTCRTHRFAKACIDTWLRKREDIHALRHIVSSRLHEIKRVRATSSIEATLTMLSSNYSARDTKRLGATIDVEQSAVRFLGSLVLVGRQSFRYLADPIRTSGIAAAKTPSSTTTSMRRKIPSLPMSPSSSTSSTSPRPNGRTTGATSTTSSRRYGRTVRMRACGCW